MGGSNQDCLVERSVFQLKEVSERIPMFVRVGILSVAEDVKEEVKRNGSDCLVHDDFRANWVD